ncbi:glycine betaine ABC transporter substrate-binding protein, partial [Georgenia sp. MJ206]
MRNTRRRGAVLATTTALALTLAGCGSSDEPAGDADGTTTAGGAADAEPITIGIHSGWEEGIAVSYLWAHILQEQGYEVELETADAGIVFTGLAEGDYDVNFDTWLPLTHGDYLEEFGDRITELGMWLEEAPLTIAVNEDAPIDSLAELAENADLFDNRLIGIESGAGLTGVVQDSVIPAYGLEDMEFLISSTPAMLAELEAATDAGENVVVTLWEPHWAYDAYPIKNLEDPEGALGEADDIYAYGTTGFADEYP